MAVALRGAAASAANSPTITIPAATQPDDLILISAGMYYEDIGTTSPVDQGFSLIANLPSSLGTYPVFHRVWAKWAVAADAGKAITISPMTYPQYGGVTCVVISGTTSMLGTSGFAAGAAVIDPGTSQEAVDYHRILFLAQFANVSTVPVFTLPSAHTALASATGSGGYFRNMIAWRNNPVAGGYALSDTVSSSQSGSNSGIALAIDTGVLAPLAPTVHSPAQNFKGPLTQGVYLSWTHNDPGGLAQAKVRITRRAVWPTHGDGVYQFGDMEYWTGTGWSTDPSTQWSTTASSVTITDWPSDEVTYRISIATANATLWGPGSEWQTLNPWEWWDGAAWVPMPTASAIWLPGTESEITIPGNTFEAGEYDWAVATKDEEGEPGPYSVTRSFFIEEQSGVRKVAIGDNLVDAFYLGDVPVAAMYLGDTQVFG